MIRGARVNPAKSLVERRIQLIYHLSNRVMLKPLEDHVNKISATIGKKTKQHPFKYRCIDSLLLKSIILTKEKLDDK